ncbi:MAG TPA: MauE/DoxX family redox-associated membrane protein [Streptosporangiaceae bacterium]|jgi:hypothetical protein
MLIELTAWAVAFALSGALLWAALEKLRAPTEFGETLRALGLPAPVRRAAVVAVPLAELAAAAGLLLVPGQVWPRALVLLLAAGFALAGVQGLRAAEPIACSCFGATGNATLGARQLYALPLWLAGVGALSLIGRDWTYRQGLALLAVLIAGLCGARAVRLARGTRAAIGDRQAVSEALEPHHSPIFTLSEERS